MHERAHRMKISYNITTCDEDLDRFSSTEDFLEFSKRFDGVEVSYYAPDERRIIPYDKIVGYHMMSYLSWLDLWNGDLDAVIREYDSLEIAEQQYGGLDREALLRPLRADLKRAHEFGAEYVVFHIAENYLHDTFTFNWSKSDEEVIEGVCELLNCLFAEEDGSIALLMENLWEPGLNFKRPELAQRLIDGVDYPNKGFMLDTGHLLHTNLELASQEEGLAFINSKIDELDRLDLTKYVRGMHLQQSITSEHCKSTIANPPDWTGKTFKERQWEAFGNAFKIDLHQPFTCAGVDTMIKRLPLEYLTFEFITATLEQHREYLDAQWKALESLGR